MSHQRIGRLVGQLAPPAHDGRGTDSKILCYRAQTLSRVKTARKVTRRGAHDAQAPPRPEPPRCTGAKTQGQTRSSRCPRTSFSSMPRVIM